MVIKICGIKFEENVQMINNLDIEMIGLNFYPSSVRYIGNIAPKIFSSIPWATQRVGVFVNEELAKIRQAAIDYQLDYIQLHGDESVEFCRKVASSYKVIKVFRIDAAFDFSIVNQYPFVDYYLFDTATVNYGGSGKKFDWTILNQYKGKTPFLLSGGIGPKDADSLNQISHSRFAGIDINSKFESSPGLKDEALVRKFLLEI